MKKIVFTLLLLVGTLSSFTMIHKFYVSVMQIDFSKESKTCQITCRIFIDDMETLLRERYDPAITLVSGNQELQIDAYLKKYLREKIKIAINDKEVQFNFIGKEYENDLMLCYMEIEGVDTLQKITISNSMLMEVFEEQQNIVHVKKGNTRKSLILQKEKEEDMLKFSE